MNRKYIFGVTALFVILCSGCSMFPAGSHGESTDTVMK